MYATGATDDGRIEVVAPARFYDLHGHEQLVEQALRLHGEVDAANDELFAALLGAAAERAAASGTDATRDTHTPVGGGHGERGAEDPARESRGPLLVLDCAGLDYSGVAAWRAAMAGTEAFRADGGRVALTGLRPHTVRILHMTGFASAFDLPSQAGDGGGR